MIALFVSSPLLRTRLRKAFIGAVQPGGGLFVAGMVGSYFGKRSTWRRMLSVCLLGGKVVCGWRRLGGLFVCSLGGSEDLEEVGGRTRD